MKFFKCPNCNNNGLPFMNLLGPPRSKYVCKVCGANLKISLRSGLEFWGIFMVSGYILSKLWDQLNYSAGENNGFQLINLVEIVFVYGPPILLAVLFVKAANRTLMEVIKKPPIEK